MHAAHPPRAPRIAAPVAPSKRRCSSSTASGRASSSSTCWSGTLRFNEIRRLLPDVTQRMLTNQLRELEADGLIVRTVYPAGAAEGGIHSAPRGKTLEPVIMALKAWGDQHIDLKIAPESADRRSSSKARSRGAAYA